MKKSNSAKSWDDPVFVLNKVINCIIFILIGLGIVILVLFVAGIRPYVVLSGSMEPAVHTGSLVFVNHNASFADVKKDDIITFKSGDATVTHRVYEVKDGRVVTKGDANDEPDNKAVTADTFVGKDVYIVSKLGYLVQFLQSALGIVISGAIVVALVIGSLLTDKKIAVKKEQ